MPPPLPKPAPVVVAPVPLVVSKPADSAPASKAAQILAQVSRDMPIDVPTPAPKVEQRRPRVARPDLEAVARDVVDQPVGLVDESLRDDALVKAVLEKFEGSKLVND